MGLAKTSTTKGTKVHEGKAGELKIFVALCVPRGSGVLRPIVDCHYRPLTAFEKYRIPGIGRQGLGN
jgi:hypothetical protein